jgi:hypothetical protein
MRRSAAELAGNRRWLGQLPTRDEACAWITIKPQPRKRGPHSAHRQSGFFLRLNSKSRAERKRGGAGIPAPAVREPLPQRPRKVPWYSSVTGGIKSPALTGAGRFRGYESTLPRPCQGRPQWQLSGRSSCRCEGWQARSNWLLLGSPSRPGQIPLWAGFTRCGPKHL